MCKTCLIAIQALLLTVGTGSIASAELPETIRFATLNASLNRRRAGALIADLKKRDNLQARRIAEILQRVRPQVILLNEFDYDQAGHAARLFQENYLAVGQNGKAPLEYGHRYMGPVNTGVPSGMDLNKDGKNDGPADAYGFGRFPGQYGMVVYSKFPIEQRRVRSFQKFLWKDMPDARLPLDPDSGKSFYGSDVLKVFRLSSKSHWDIPLNIEGDTIHFLVAHPTPPVFDGAEDRNGCRNHDEIRLFADYIDPNRSGYIYDDNGTRGGLKSGARFVIAGDLNADPFDGDSTAHAIRQLTAHPLIRDTQPTSAGAVEVSQRNNGVNERHKGNPAHDTANFGNRVGNLRVDYILPSKNVRVVKSGVFWPRAKEETSRLLRASDHRLVWIDVSRRSLRERSVGPAPRSRSERRLSTCVRLESRYHEQSVLFQ